MAVAANAILNVIFIGFFKLIHWEAEHMALALASTGSAMVNAGLLYFICINNIFRFGALEKIFMQFMFANVVMIAALAYALSWYNGDVSQWMRVLEVLILCVVGVVAYLAALVAAGFRPYQTVIHFGRIKTRAKWLLFFCKTFLKQNSVARPCRERKPTMARITAITNKIIAKSLDKPATPPKPSRLAIKAITAKIIAQRNISILHVFYSQIQYRNIRFWALLVFC